MIAACTNCGSCDLSTPIRGRRTGRFFCTCRDCGAANSFDERPEVQARRNRPAPPPRVPIADGLKRLTDAFLDTWNANDPKLRQIGDTE